MRRALACDGVIIEKVNAQRQEEAASPADIRNIKAFVDANRTLSTPFDIVLNGQTSSMPPGEASEKFAALQDAGLNWWIEGFWDASEENVAEYIKKGPPEID